MLIDAERQWHWQLVRSSLEGTLCTVSPLQRNRARFWPSELRLSKRFDLAPACPPVCVL